jgi:hypothetical protein
MKDLLFIIKNRRVLAYEYKMADNGLYRNGKILSLFKR